MGIKHLFIITSVIHFNTGKLSYSGTRSVFSPEERIEQTIATITSVKRYMPDAYILLLEMGNNGSLPKKLTDLVSEYRYIGADPLVHLACNSAHKGLGEAVGLLKGTKTLPRANMYLKMSGRYALTPAFDPDIWHGKGFLAHIRDTAFSTRLYGISANAIPFWRRTLFLSLPFLLLGKGIEQILLRLLPKKMITHISVLGISGAIAPNGEMIEE